MFCALLLMLLIPAALAEDNRYDAVGFYGEYDMCPVQRDGKWGFVDHTGTLILPCEWDGVGIVMDGRVPVQKDGKWGAIDREGNLIVPCRWQYLVAEDDGGYTVTDFNGYQGALAADGSVLIPCDRYKYVGPVINGARSICQDDLWGLCTETGEIITPCQWYETGYFHDGLAWVTGEARARGYINMQGELVIPCQYNHADDFVNGSAAVQFSNGNYQLINTEGRYLFETACPEMESYSKNELLRVGRDGKYGYINRRGEVVVPLIYDNAQGFQDGLAMVKQGDETFWIDENGTRVLDRPQGHSAWQLCGGYVCLKNEEGLLGVMDKSGAFIIPCQWPDGLINPFMRGEITCMWTDTHYAFFNKQGEMVTGAMHERGKFQYAIHDEYLFLAEEGVLSIWRADGTKVY